MGRFWTETQCERTKLDLGIRPERTKIDQNLVPNGLGIRPEQFGTGSRSVRARLSAKTGLKPVSEARPGLGTGLKPVSEVRSAKTGLKPA